MKRCVIHLAVRPNKNQYIDIIKNGDDSKDKRVILFLTGKFLMSYSDNDVERDPKSYVGRSETLDAGNDYAGEDADKDMKYINGSYAMFLKAWIKYKKDNITGQYLEIYPRESVAELEAIIDTLQ